MQQDIFIPQEHGMNAQDGDKVVVQITSYGSRNKKSGRTHKRSIREKHRSGNRCTLGRQKLWAAHGVSCQSAAAGRQDFTDITGR